MSKKIKLQLIDGKGEIFEKFLKENSIQFEKIEGGEKVKLKIGGGQEKLLGDFLTANNIQFEEIPNDEHEAELEIIEDENEPDQPIETDITPDPIPNAPTPDSIQ